jgi:hypothetical protein
LNDGTSQAARIQYLCQVVNRFQCPFEGNAASEDTPFDVDALFRLHKHAFAVENSLAKEEG